MEPCVGSWRPEYLRGPLMPEAFARQAAARPLSPCLVSEDGSALTFAEVDAKAGTLARRLRAAGVGRDVAVAILLDRSPAVVVSMLAVHKAGGCYVPLDPGFPVDRLAIYVEDSEARALIAEPGTRPLAASLLEELPTQPQVLMYDASADAASTAAGPPRPDVGSLQPSDLAYIMFTSGSTGRPKGVMVTHGGVRDLVAFNIERFVLGPSDVFCLNSTVGFDSYVTYVFAALALGARLVVPGPTAHLDPTGMAGLIAAHGITTMECVPALASEYMAAFRAAGASVACLTRFLTGGEALTPKLAAAVYDALPGLRGPLPHQGLFNSYGPTEVTVTTITGHITPPFDKITMGLPDHNVHTYVVHVDEAAPDATNSNSSANGNGGPPPLSVRLAAVGEPGELWLSGPRLARGYRNRPDMTAKAFVPNPFFEASTAGLAAAAVARCAPPGAADELRRHYATAYRTGDLTVQNADGTIDFLGRVDRQVKVNGVRMEVGEIENVLAGAPGVCHAAVKPWKDSNGAYRLCGYVAPDSVDLAAADHHLRSKLLPAMVPSKLVLLAQMPRLPNGKIDVKVLEEPDWGPAPGDAAAANGAGLSAAPPNTPLEHLVAEAWSEVLGVPVTDATANFFQLGGSSLRAGLINSRIRRATGLDVPGMLIYSSPTIRGLCSAIEEICGAWPPPGPPPASALRSREDVGAFEAIMEAEAAGAAAAAPAGEPGAAAGGRGRKAAGKAGAGRRAGLPTPLVGMLQFGGYLLSGLIGWVFFLPTFLVLHWLFGFVAAPLWVIVVASPILMAADLLFVAGFLIATKWLVLGRVRPGTVPLFGGFYVRWWIVRLTYKASMAVLFPFVRNSPLMAGLLRALGARVGRNVTIDTLHTLDWDLLDIGNNVAFEAESHIEGSHFKAGTSPGARGTITLAKTVVGEGCTVLPQSIVSAGTSLAPRSILEPGTTSARPPAEPADDAAHDAVRTERGAPPAVVWVPAVLLLIFIQSFMWATLVPSVALWYGLNAGSVDGDWRSLLADALRCWLRVAPVHTTCPRLLWTEAVALLLMAPAGIAGATLYMWLLVPAKWLLVGRISQAWMDKAGYFARFRLHVWRCLLRGPFTALIHIWTSTEVYNAWMRCLGAKIGRQCWLSEFFRCSEFEMYEVGDTASVCSMVTVVGSTNAHTAKVKLGAGCDVTNDCTLLPGCVVGDGAVLGVYTYGRPGQVFAPYSIQAGDFMLRPGVADVEAGLAAGTLEAPAARLIPGWQYGLYHVLYIAAALTLFTATQAAMTLPVPLATMAVMYGWGVWPAVLAFPLYPVVGFALLLGYLTLVKRVIMADTGGEYSIFTSVSAAKWQMLCLNIHMYQDFDQIKGSVFYNLYMRAMGTRVGKDVCCLGLVAHEFEQVTIGDGAVIAEGSFLLTHTVENRRVKIRPITIGARATVGAHSCVLPDASLEDGATLEDMSLVMKGEQVPRNSHWAGVPAYAVLTANIAKLASSRLSGLLSITLSQQFSAPREASGALRGRASGGLASVRSGKASV